MQQKEAVAKYATKKKRDFQRRLNLFLYLCHKITTSYENENVFLFRIDRVAPHRLPKQEPRRGATCNN